MCLRIVENREIPLTPLVRSRIRARSRTCLRRHHCRPPLRNRRSIGGLRTTF